MKITKQWDQADNQFIRRKLIDYNGSCLPKETKNPFENVSFVLRNEKEESVGGITGTIFWAHLHIDLLWVDERFRSKGYGLQLMEQMEAYARTQGCRLILLDTFSFQAPEFYKRLGFQVLGTVEDHPKGYQLYYLEKRLT